MAFQDYILSNIRWKLVALALAVVVWLTVRFSLLGDIRPGLLGSGDVSTYSRIPVLTLTVPGDPQVFQISPREVEIKIRRSRSDRILSASDIKAFVNVSDITVLTGVSRVMEISVQTPKDFEIIHINPASVAVEQLAAPLQTTPTQSLTNSLITP